MGVSICLKYCFKVNQKKNLKKNAAFRARILGGPHRGRDRIRIGGVLEKSRLPVGRNRRGGKPNPQFQRVSAYRGGASVGMRLERVDHRRDDVSSFSEVKCTAP